MEMFQNANISLLNVFINSLISNVSNNVNNIIISNLINETLEIPPNIPVLLGNANILSSFLYIIAIFTCEDIM